MQRLTALAFAFALLFTACSSGPLITTQNVTPAVRTDTLDASYSETLDAVMGAYSKRGFGVDEVNEDAGFVKSGYKQSGNLVGAKGRNQVTAQLTRLTDSTTQVRLTMTGERQSMGQWSTVSMPKKKAQGYYVDAFETIREQF